MVLGGVAAPHERGAPVGSWEGGGQCLVSKEAMHREGAWRALLREAEAPRRACPPLGLIIESRGGPYILKPKT